MRLLVLPSLLTNIYIYVYIYICILHADIQTRRRTYNQAYKHSHIQAYIRTYPHTHTCPHTDIQTFMHTHMQTCSHADIRSYRHTHIQTNAAQAYKHANTQKYRQTHKDMHTYRHTHADIHTDIQAHTHTHMHTYKHVNIQPYKQTYSRNDIHCPCMSVCACAWMSVCLYGYSRKGRGFVETQGSVPQRDVGLFWESIGGRLPFHICRRLSTIWMFRGARGGDLRGSQCLDGTPWTRWIWEAVKGASAP